MTEYIKNQLIKLCDNPEWFNDMLNTWDFKPERESQAIKEYLSHVLLNGKLENTHIERIESQGRMVSEFIRLRLREILQICLSDINIIDIIPLP